MGWHLCQLETVPCQNQGPNSHWLQQCNSRSKICKKPVFCVNSANGSMPEAWFCCCFLCSATTGGRLWICGCSPDLKLWLPCSLNLPLSEGNWAQIFSCLPKSAGCQPNASLWRLLGSQPEQAASWPEEVMKTDIILLSHLMVVLLQVYKGVQYDWSFPLAMVFALSLTFDKILASHCSLPHTCGWMEIWIFLQSACPTLSKCTATFCL